MEKKFLNNEIKRVALLLVILIAVASVISSCNKSGADCFTSTGTVIKEAADHVSDFDTIIAQRECRYHPYTGFRQQCVWLKQVKKIIDRYKDRSYRQQAA
jgi:predicted small secreted protein